MSPAGADFQSVSFDREKMFATQHTDGTSAPARAGLLSSESLYTLCHVERSETSPKSKEILRSTQDGSRE
ncbi:hypothetical protein [Dysgonomonas termitidis]|uniref:Uncharacterized protein n=1 Tax=Dysgonomonas termitidis TaxID=1516126 RepID=A0ABV9L1U3_9BACT